MTVAETIIKKAIKDILVPYFNTAKVKTEKTVTKQFPISEGLTLSELNKEISAIAEKTGFDKDSFSIESYCDSSERCMGMVASIDIQEPLTEKEYRENLKKKVNNSTFPKIKKVVVDKKGLSRVSPYSSEFKKFDDTSVFDMLEKKDYDRLVQYYSLYFQLKEK